MHHHKRMLLVALLAALPVALGACEDKKKNDKATANSTSATTAATTTAAEDKAADKPGAEDSKPHSSAIPGTPNQLIHDQNVPEVTFEFATPKADEVIEAGKPVDATFKLGNYRTGKEIGQHIHVILDNQPYKALYDAEGKMTFTDVPEGTHHLVAFPARHYHLALKQGDVFKHVKFHVGKKGEDKLDPSKPWLIYSRPKGTYSAEAGKALLLDFYVRNAEIGKDAKIMFGVDGKETTLEEWKPVLLPPMESGEHKITLKLVDMSGKVIENGGWNNVERTITVE